MPSTNLTLSDNHTLAEYAGCAGTGICPACHGRRTGCARCRGTGTCTDCGGAGAL